MTNEATSVVPSCSYMTTSAWAVTDESAIDCSNQFQRSNVLVIPRLSVIVPYVVGPPRRTWIPLFPPSRIVLSSWLISSPSHSANAPSHSGAPSATEISVENKLPGAHSFKDTGKVLAGTRSTCAWAALGHAVAAYETALTYSKRRQQFGRPLCSFQIVQDRLVRMLAEVTAMQLYCLQIGRLAQRGQLSDTIAGLAKLNNTRKARQVCAEARDMLGGNGILLENHVIRHMADIEAIHTYEGTETMQTLIVGRDITGVGAFT
jgi:hypothetical protein